MIFMKLTLEELCEKEVVNLNDGACFGFAEDILMDTETKEVIGIIVREKRGPFGFLAKEKGTLISWEKIETVGKDIILVKTEQKIGVKTEKMNFFQKILNIFFY